MIFTVFGTLKDLDGSGKLAPLEICSTTWVHGIKASEDNGELRIFGLNQQGI
jgi:hypothetical protein